MKNIFVNKSFSILLLSLNLILAFSILNHAYASQSSEKYDTFNNYSNWGITIQPLIYHKAQKTKEYGNIELINKNTFTFNAGIEYKFKSANQFSMNTSLYIGYEPVFFYDYYIDIDDNDYLFNPGIDSIRVVGDPKYDKVSFSVPVLLEFKQKLNDKIYFNINSGIKTMIYPYSQVKDSSILSSVALGGYQEVLYISVNSSDKYLKSSLYFSCGIYFVLNNMLLKTNIVYNRMLSNLYEGSYKFDNLFVSPATGGKYNLSGDYWGVSVSLFFKKNA